MFHFLIRIKTQNLQLRWTRLCKGWCNGRIRHQQVVHVCVLINENAHVSCKLSSMAVHVMYEHDKDRWTIDRVRGHKVICPVKGIRALEGNFLSCRCRNMQLMVTLQHHIHDIKNGSSKLYAQQHCNGGWGMS